MAAENPEMGEVWTAACETLKRRNMTWEGRVRKPVFDIDSVSE